MHLLLKIFKWANEKATNEQIQHMCKEAYADSFIKSFPEGYETLVGDRGIRLSGGQLQRIALARALIRKPEILILDEATSSLDSKSEKNIQEALNTIARKTTIIVIAHRLSTILKADHIFVINHGRVVEEGNYEDLIKLNGSFKKMIEQQAFILGEKIS
jgi:ABC-type multidrug transport system fused ATPase/permease subunit